LLIALEEMSYEEAAAVLDIPIGTLMVENTPRAREAAPNDVRCRPK
jgi:DNA-directed RNA polymerase specialized sigma24 family protein